MISEAAKQTILSIFWLGVGVIFQYTEQPTMPVLYAFAGAIGLGLFITVIWIISPLATARVYRERIDELEHRLVTIEMKFQAAQEQNAILREANSQYELDMKNALEHIRHLSGEINRIKEHYGEITNSGG